jgi:serine/threonine protein kinase
LLYGSTPEHCCFTYLFLVGRFHDLLLELTVTAEISQSKHPNVVNFVGAAAKFPAAHEQQADWSIGLVFELCDPFDLYHLLHKHKIKLTMAQKLRLARESAAGLAHLHSCGFLHRDFGSRNLLLREGHIQITDFGIARKMPRSGLNASYRPATVCGTLPWMAPEQIAGQILSPYSDVFALGTVLWELLTQTVPFSDVNDPLQHNLQLMRDALNTRDFSMGGWPIGPNARQGPTMPLSKTLQAPPDDSLEGLASGAKDDLRILVCLLHEHLPVLRPTAEEAHEVLKSLEKQLAASSSSWKTLFISHRDNRDILLVSLVCKHRQFCSRQSRFAYVERKCQSKSKDASGHGMSSTRIGILYRT